MPSRAASGPPAAVEPLGVVVLINPTVYPVHPSPDPHRMHYGVLREDGTLVESTVGDRHHGGHTFIPPDPGRFAAVDAMPREAIYAGHLYPVYGHFLLESCQRLWWAADHPELPIVWTTDDVTAAELNRWQRDLLDILGVGNEVIVVTRPTRFDQLHVPDAGYKYADWSHPQHIAFLAGYQGPPQEPGRKLWLSLDPAHGRGVTNRHIVERRLRNQGWTVVTFELMPVRDQLDALARAEVIAGEEASTFHNLLLLKDIAAKRFHIFRRHGPEHLSFATIGDARGVDQQFHSCSQDVVLSTRGRAVVRLAPNAAQYLDHLAIPVPPAPAFPIDPETRRTVRRLSRLARTTSAETCLQVGALDDAVFTGVEVARCDVVDEELPFDVRSYPDRGTRFYEVSLDQFLTWFAAGRRYDLVLISSPASWREALRDVRALFSGAAHDRTVVVLDHVASAEAARPGGQWHADVYKTLLALDDLHPELAFRSIAGDRGPQTLIWRRQPTGPGAAEPDGIRGLRHREVRRRNPFATVTEDRAVAAVRDALSPRPNRGLLRRLTSRRARRG